LKSSAGGLPSVAQKIKCSALQSSASAVKRIKSRLLLSFAVKQFICSLIKHRACAVPSLKSKEWSDTVVKRAVHKERNL